MISNGLSFRLQFFVGALICAGLMGYALYSEFHLHLEPCPLCIFQRIAMIALGVVFLLGSLLAPGSVGGRRAWAVLAIMTALAGAAIACRHLWLQSLPADQVPACGPPLSFMMNWPFEKMLTAVFKGSGECAEVNWRFLGLAMPAWTLISFVTLGAWAAFAGFRRTRVPPPAI
ncbi:MAG: disulfide bond formation protein B [Lysobacteraceae bacterium]